jgi:hypothetical protein
MVASALCYFDAAEHPREFFHTFIVRKLHDSCARAAAVT